MKIGIPEWNGWISPVFDTARRLVVIDAENGAVVGRSEQALGQSVLPRRAAEVAGLGVDVLICGAVSRPLAGMLAASGVQVIPFVTGPVEQVLAMYLSGGQPAQAFPMPGAGRRGRRRLRKGGGPGGRGRRW